MQLCVNYVQTMHFMHKLRINYAYIMLVTQKLRNIMQKKCKNYAKKLRKNCVIFLQSPGLGHGPGDCGQPQCAGSGGLFGGLRDSSGSSVLYLRPPAWPGSRRTRMVWNLTWLWSNHETRIRWCWSLFPNCLFRASIKNENIKVWACLFGSLWINADDLSIRN